MSFITLCRLYNMRQTRLRCCKLLFESRNQRSVSKQVQVECRPPVTVSFKKQSVFPLNQNVHGRSTLGVLQVRLSFYGDSNKQHRQLVILLDTLLIFCLTLSSTSSGHLIMQVVCIQNQMIKAFCQNYRIRTEDNAFYTDTSAAALFCMRGGQLICCQHASKVRHGRAERWVAELCRNSHLGRPPHPVIAPHRLARQVQVQYRLTRAIVDHSIIYQTSILRYFIALRRSSWQNELRCQYTKLVVMIY